MARRSYRPEQIIKKLREAEVLLNQGSTIGEAARKLGVTEQTYYRWRREYGGIRIGEVMRLLQLELANSYLSRVQGSISQLRTCKCPHKPCLRHWCTWGTIQC